MDVELKPLIKEQKIKERVACLVEEIVNDLHQNELVVIGLLKGSFMFLADLVRELHGHKIPIVIDFMTVSSYGTGTESSGTIEMTRDVSTDVADSHVLIVDDILDTGITLDFVYNHLKEMGPAVIKTCVLLEKAERRKVHFEADYVGFNVPNEFVVGYGLDYDNRYRELPYVSLLSIKG